jgi:2-oxoglutarate dehydrogenase E2 component (dihydrolipoamide succinyltransferase)
MSTEVEIRAPAEQTEGTRSQILRWLKAVGDPVTENEPLIEIETDKVTVEVAAPGSGTLLEIFKQEQDEIGPGDLLGRIGANGTDSIDAVAAKPAVASARSTTAAIAAFGATPISDAGSASSPGPGTTAGPASAAAPASVRGSAAAVQALSPAVRRLLAERGLDASEVRGTGQGGRITVEDVLAHDAAIAVGGPATATTVAATSGPTSAAAPIGIANAARVHTDPAQIDAAPGAHATVADASDPAAAIAAATVAAGTSAAASAHRIPHTATRKRIAEHMVQSLLHTAPHVTTVFEADLTAVLEHRQRNKDDFARRGAPLTLTAYFLQAAVAAIRAVPEANSRWTDSALEVFESMHIGVATALETGLVVPVLRDVQSRDLFETAQGLEDLVSRAREGRLSPADVRGGTFTMSNHGVSGSLVATPIIINQPQSAILGVGKLEKRPVVVSENAEDRIVIRPRCYVTLTIDHRVMDGHQANRFLQTFVERLVTSHL